MKCAARAALALTCAALLAACSLSPDSPGSPLQGGASSEQAPAPSPKDTKQWARMIAPPAGAKQAFRASGRGYQEFRCTQDKLGLYWKFVRPHAILRDASGNELLEQEDDMSFTHRKGGTLRVSIAKAAPANGYNLRWVLMKASGGTGALQRIGHVQRINTSGGIPMAVCSPSQKGQLMRVPFTADFIFWRR